MAPSIFIGTLGLLTLLGAFLYEPVSHRLTVFGLFRPKFRVENIHGVADLIKIPNTVHCEDLHYHRASNKLYTACEGSVESRLKWFPPFPQTTDHTAAGQGKIVVIDPVVGKSSGLPRCSA